jgi:hypothetical protein
MSRQKEIVETIKNTINIIEDAFFEIDIAMLQCPDIKSFTNKFISNIDILKSQLKELENSDTSHNLISSNSDIMIDTINYQQLKKFIT